MAAHDFCRQQTPASTKSQQAASTAAGEQNSNIQQRTVSPSEQVSSMRLQAKKMLVKKQVDSRCKTTLTDGETQPHRQLPGPRCMHASG
jgi:hypothetical protein